MAASAGILIGNVAHTCLNRKARPKSKRFKCCHEWRHNANSLSGARSDHLGHIGRYHSKTILRREQRNDKFLYNPNNDPRGHKP